MHRREPFVCDFLFWRNVCYTLEVIREEDLHEKGKEQKADIQYI